jgi:hypothetical protein
MDNPKTQATFGTRHRRKIKIRVVYHTKLKRGEARTRPKKKQKNKEMKQGAREG